MLLLPSAAEPLIMSFSIAFTEPTFQRFVSLLVGAVLTRGRHTVTAVLRTLRQWTPGHHTTYHRIFSRAVWSPWPLGKTLATAILRWIPADEPVLVPMDDTTAQHRGAHVYGKGCHHDAVRSSHSHIVWRWGHRWVVLAVSTAFPFTHRRWALPVLAALYRPEELNRAEGRRHKTAPYLARQLMAVLMHWFPRRKFVFLGDGGYASHELARFCNRHRRHATLVSRFYPDANLYAPAPQRRNPVGRPRTKGRKLPQPQDTVKRSAPTPATVSWYGGGQQNKQIRLSASQRMRLAAKAKRLSRTLLERCTELFTPDTVMRWYRDLIARKYDGSEKRKSSGRPPISQEIVHLVIRFKEDNPRWGYRKITDQVVYLGHTISKSAVKTILIDNGYDPEPDLTVRSTWHEFLRSHWDVLAACDFFTIELLVKRKLVRCTVFFVMELATRKVFFASVQLQPDGAYMKQVARILTDMEDGFLNGKRYLIHDRDPLYRTEGFHDILKTAGIKPVILPARSPDLNCYAERFVKSVKSECLDHLILSSVEQLEYVLRQFGEYYHHERIHQSLGKIIEPKHKTDPTAEIVCIERLGGLLKSYHRLAA